MKLWQNNFLNHFIPMCEIIITRHDNEIVFHITFIHHIAVISFCQVFQYHHCTFQWKILFFKHLISYINVGMVDYIIITDRYYKPIVYDRPFTLCIPSETGDETAHSYQTFFLSDNRQKCTTSCWPDFKWMGSCKHITLILKFDT